MTRESYLGLDNVALEADVKPSLPKHRWLEQDTGRFWYHNGTEWVLGYGFDLEEVYANKQIDSRNNTIYGLGLDARSARNSKVKGGMIPSKDPFYGALGGMTIDSTLPIEPVWDATDGLIMKFEGGFIGDRVAARSPAPLVRLADAEFLEIKCKGSATATIKMLVGFANYIAIPDTIFENTDSGLLVGYTNNSANYEVYSNDGSGPMETTLLGLGVPKTTTLRTISFDMTPTSVTVKLDGGSATVINTKLPSPTTDLYAFFQIHVT